VTRSLAFVKKTKAEALKNVSQCKNDIALLEADRKIIKSPQLIQTCDEMLKRVREIKKKALNTVKFATIDEQHLGAILKKVK